MKNYAQVQLKSKKAPKKSGSYDHIRVKKADNGGHIVEVHGDPFDSKPEVHSYGEHEGGDALRKVAELSGIKYQAPSDGDNDNDDSGEEQE